MISLILVALSTSPADLTGSPAWQTDYRAALVQGARQHKPLAVFLVSGKKGWQKVRQSGLLSDEVQQLLGAKYVAVFVDTQTAPGKALASAFELSGEVGLVLSDRGGHYQAFRHEGILAQERLVAALKRHADSEGPPKTTETARDLVSQETSAATSLTSVSLAPTYPSQEVQALTCSH